MVFTITPSPVREWIAIHLLRQPLSSNTNTWQPTLKVSSEKAKDAAPFINIQSGYPEPDLRGPNAVITERHFLIDGCPATAAICKFSILHNPQKRVIAGTYLCVCTPDFSGVYVGEILGDSRYADLIDREMQAIIASFHVEKVTEGKR